MARLIEAKTREELDKWIHNLDTTHFLGLNTKYTKSLALQPCEPGSCPEAYISFDGKKSDELDAILSGALVDSLKFAAPIPECAWNLTNKIFTEGMAWFNANKDQKCMAWDKKYDTLRSTLPSPEDVAQYQIAARKWRKDIGYECSPNNGIMRGEVTKVYIAPKKYVNDMILMVTDMRSKRRHRLGITEEQEQEALSRKGAKHAPWVEDWVKGGEDRIFSLPSWGGWNKKTKKGLLLGGTAVAHLVQKKVITLKIFRSKVEKAGELLNNQQKMDELGIDVSQARLMHAHMEGCLKEAEGLIKDSVTSAYVQQGSALDTAFSTYYWMWKADVTLANFGALNEMAFLYGQKPVGQKKLLDTLKGTAYKWGSTLANMCATGDFNGERVHMHPGVFTPHRMSEMTAAIGAFPLSNPVKIKEGSASYRYLTNLKTSESNPAAKVVCELFNTHRRAHSDWNSPTSIVPPEHYFHQSLLERLGPFCHVSLVRGNALRVNIVEEMGTGGNP
nr:nucleoprotein [Yezo virus]